MKIVHAFPSKLIPRRERRICFDRVDLPGKKVAFLGTKLSQDLLQLDRLLQIFLGDWISVAPAEVRGGGRPLTDRSGRNTGSGRGSGGPELDPAAGAGHPGFLLVRFNDE